MVSTLSKIANRLPGFHFETNSCTVTTYSFAAKTPKMSDRRQRTRRPRAARPWPAARAALARPGPGVGEARRNEPPARRGQEGTASACRPPSLRRKAS